MGALVAFELSRALRRQGLPLPRAMIVSGRRPPTVPEHRTASPCTFRMIRSWMRWFAATTRSREVIRNEPELMALFVPVLKADFEIIETHVHQDEPPLPCAVAFYGGRDDPQTRQMDGWASLFGGPSRFRQFDGGHFYIAESTSGGCRRAGGRCPGRQAFSRPRPPHMKDVRG